MGRGGCDGVAVEAALIVIGNFAHAVVISVVIVTRGAFLAHRERRRLALTETKRKVLAPFDTREL
jgi:hypothetical protein